VPLTEPHWLEGGVVMCDDATLSTLLDPDADGRVNCETAPGDNAAPGIAPHEFTEARIQPDGALMLPRRAADAWCVTFTARPADAEQAQPPRDSRTVVVNPFTTATRVY
jgi:hypothetical protein